MSLGRPTPEMWQNHCFHFWGKKKKKNQEQPGGTNVVRARRRGKDLSVCDEWACQIKDNLIMFIGSGFNLADCIRLHGACLDICFNTLQLRVLRFWAGAYPSGSIHWKPGS